MSSQLRTAPAHEVPWEDVVAVFGRGESSVCWCTRFKMMSRAWFDTPREVKADLLREWTQCDVSGATGTAGLVGYLDDEPVAWVAVEPRPAYPRIPEQRAKLKARGEDLEDASVWAVTCFLTRVGHRRTGLTGEMLDAAVRYAAEHGADVVEGYPMITHPGQDIIWGEVHVGSRSTFDRAGFREVLHPTKRRVVMRLEL